MAVGGSSGNYPTLASITKFIRSIVNDDKQGATGTPGEGQILTDTSFTMIQLLDAAIEETYQDCHIMSHAALIKDQYLVLNLPPVNSSLGVGAVNPAVQTALTFNGYFDGLQLVAGLTLPSDLLYPLEVWERQGGTPYPFNPMKEKGGALDSRNQTGRMGEWEWRTDAMWFHGCILPTDLRLRYIATYVSIVASSVNFATTYVPISNSKQAIADKVAARYARRLGGDIEERAEMRADKSILKLKQQVVKSRQGIDHRPPPFGGSRAGQAGDPASYLY